MSRRLAMVALLAALGAALAPPAAAVADGLPVPVDDAGGTGVTSADGGRYVTVRAGRDTVVQRVERDGGRIAASALLRGRFGIPVVALDGSASGLSHDGRTLVVLRPRRTFPQASSRFAVIDASSLRVRRLIEMRGDFSFDALSPDGRTIYLIQYRSGNDPTQYLVRAVDTASGRLDPKPVVDPKEEPGEMYGLPLTRAVSPDGRWHYTLYDGQHGHPFIHALDTRDRAAVCIDLPPELAQGDLFGLRLRVDPGGGRIDVGSDPRYPIVTVDTGTFRVTPVKAAAAPDDSAGRSDSGSNRLPLYLAAAIAGVAGLVGLAVAVRRRRRERAVIGA